MDSNELPAILVSAVDVAAASEIITELISDNGEPPQTNGLGVHGPSEEAEEAATSEARGVRWRLDNKYYSACVRLLPIPDRPARPAPSADVQAHLIYLTEEECSDGSACSRRADAASARLARGAVRLVGARCASPPRALAAWARAARYELVPLLAPERGERDERDERDEREEREAAGAARLREALHAHVWPGLERRGAPTPLDVADGESSAESSDESWGSWRRAGDGGDGGDGGGGDEGAAQFAAALALLPAARAAGAAGAGDAGGAGGDAARRLRAEQLVAAFCRALGEPLPRGAPQ